MIDAISIAETVLGHARVPHARVSVVELNRSTPRETVFALLVFVDDRPDPSLFIKATPDPQRAAQLEQEFRNLTLLHAHAAPDFARSIPGPVYLDRCGELAILGETTMPGMRMKNFPPDAYFSSDRFQLHFRNTIRWLGEFGDVVPPADPVAAPGRRAEEAVEAYRERFDVSSPLDALLSRTVERLSGRALPTSPWHGDFCTANLIVDEDDRIGVIDWEVPLHRSWPLSDYLHFLCSVWCIPYRKGGAALANNFRRMFFRGSPFEKLIRETTDSYGGKLGIDPADLPALSVISWVAYANRKREILDARGAPGEHRDSDHLPLIMFEDRRCLNLELLARHGDEYLLG